MSVGDTIQGSPSSNNAGNSSPAFPSRHSSKQCAFSGRSSPTYTQPPKLPGGPGLWRRWETTPAAAQRGLLSGPDRVRAAELRGLGWPPPGLLAGLGVEAPDRPRVPLEALGSGNGLDAVLLPEAAGIAEGLHAALGADPRPGEHED